MKRDLFLLHVVEEPIEPHVENLMVGIFSRIKQITVADDRLNLVFLKIREKYCLKEL
jgi:hypothetical protein